ncbi:MAG: hypothetical protein ACRC1M_01195 [Methanobacteriaceae archaeon]
MKSNIEIQKEIIFSLFRTKHIGKRHTPIKNFRGLDFLKKSETFY